MVQEVRGERCPITELFVEQCACHRCRPAPAADPFTDPAPNLGAPFEAMYAGVCSDCGGRFDEGDEIRSDYEGGYVGPCCLAAA